MNVTTTLPEVQERTMVALRAALPDHWVTHLTTDTDMVYARATHKTCGTPSYYSIDAEGMMLVAESDPDTMHDHFTTVQYLDLEFWTPKHP